MYDTSKFKLAFPLYDAKRLFQKLPILFEKINLKEGNFFVNHPVSSEMGYIPGGPKKTSDVSRPPGAEKNVF